MKQKCCDTFLYYLEEGDLVYAPYDRSYSIIIPDDMQLPILCCPWCGVKLPDPLNDKMEEVLMEEYGLQLGSSADRGKIPPEFDADEWWKKRGL